MKSIRSLLQSATLNADDPAVADLRAFLDTTLDALAEPGINEQFRTDLLKVMTASLDLAFTLSGRTYNIDEVLRLVAFIEQRMSFILNHAITSRPRTLGFGLRHNHTGRILPNIFSSASEAARYISDLAHVSGTMPPFDVVPVELSSANIDQPKAAPAGGDLLPPRETQPPPTTPVGITPTPNFGPSSATDLPRVNSPIGDANAVPTTTSPPAPETEPATDPTSNQGQEGPKPQE